MAKIEFGPIVDASCCRQDVLLDGEKIGQVCLVLNCGPHGTELWRWCYRKRGEARFNWLSGVSGGRGDDIKMRAAKKLVKEYLG